MTRRQLYRDVNLADIAFANEGQELALTFLSLDDGSEVGTLRCCGLLVLEYHTVLSSLPLYVGEVNHDEFGDSQVAEVLRDMDYGFSDQSGAILRSHLDRLHHVYIEGGEVIIRIVCKELRGYLETKAE